MCRKLTRSSFLAKGSSATSMWGNMSILFMLFLISANFSYAQISVSFSATDPGCSGLPTGSITANVNGGVAPYTYAWSNGATTQTVTGLFAGDYTVTVTDANSNTGTGSATLTDPPVLLVDLDADDCESPVVISATPSEGAGGPYTYYWGTGETTSSISVANSGQYCVTVTDANSCGRISCITIEAMPLDVIVKVNDVTCPGFEDGSLEATVNNGMAPFTYVWSNGGNTQTIDDLAPGDYTVTVTDANGCSDIAFGSVTEPQSLFLLLGATSPSCTGDSTGTIAANVNGGTEPYSYLWSTGATTATIDDLGEGTYSLTVTDANGCDVSESVDLTPLSNLSVSTTGSDEICSGADDGSVTVTPVNGAEPYTYLWSNGATTATVDGLAPDVYTVTVTDAAGCEAIDFEVVSAASPFTLSTMQSDVSTCGAMDGSATVNVDAGSGPFTYEWSNNETTSTIDNLPAGDYMVTVTDDNDCTATASVTISEPPSVSVDVTGTSAVCDDTDDGTVTANVSGGTAPFSFLWNTGDTTQMLDSLGGGTYIVTVTDASGCTDIDSIEIDANAGLLAVLQSTEFICGDDPNSGEASVNVSSGQAPYTYSWSNGASGSTVTGLSAGDYTVTVTDINGCEAVAFGTVTLLSVLDVSQSVASDAACFGESTGAVDLVVTGGMRPYAYLWSNGSRDSVLTDVPADFYQVTVTDANSCEVTESFLVLEPDPINLLINKSDALCGDQSTSEAVALVFGGTAPYSYEWSNGATTDSIGGVAAGNYTVTVTDANECEAIETVTINDPGNPTCDVVMIENVTTLDAFDGVAEAVAVGGMAPYTYLWSNGDTSAQATGLGAIEYAVTVTDALGCETVCSVDLSQFVANALLGDYVWFDRDRDGIQDDDEHGIEGIQIIVTYLDDDGRSTMDTTTTDMNGRYQFELPPGKYKLTVIVPDSLQITQPNIESEGDDVDSDFSRDMFMADTIMLMAGDRDLHWDVGMFAGANIIIADPCVCLDNATNSKDGQFGEEVVVVEGLMGDTWQIIAQTGMFLESSPEPPLAPIPVPIGTVLMPKMDDGSMFEFRFRHVDEVGYNLTVSNGFDTLSIGRNCFYPEVTLAGLPSDSVTFCVNAEPITPTVETNIPGEATIFLNDVPVTEIDPATLGLGDHEIRLELDPFDSEECKAVAVTQVLVVNEFCPSKVGDYVWLDENRNGRQDGFEQGFDSVKVILTPVNVVDGRVDSDTMYTDENGRYCFDVLEGLYKLTFCEPEGYRITLPNNDTVPDELDSDVNRVTFMTDTFFIAGGTEDFSWDAGLVIAPGSSDRAGCNCLDNATDQDDGQFLETVNVSGVANDDWRIITSQNAFAVDSPEPPAAPTPLPLGSTFTEIELGIYEINFRHVDALPYFVEMTNGFDTLNFSKLCTYPDVVAPQALEDTLNVCVELSNYIPEIMVDQPGTFSYTIEGQPVDDINPSSLGVGTFELGVFFTPEDFTECLGVLPLFLILSTEECDAKVGDFVWLDEDEDGIQDPGEPGIEGVEVTLQNPDGSLVDVVQTDDDGAYCFLVPKGDYKITFGKPEGNFELTTPNAGGDDALDSDVNEQTMMTPVFSIEGGETDLTFDAGFIEICINVQFPGEIGQDQMVCAPGNDPGPIMSIRDASGGGMPIEYLWMKSESSENFEAGGFRPIPGAVFPSYDPGPIDVTTHYARCVRAVGCPDYIEANIVTVTVKDDAKAEIIAQPITCYLDLATFEVVTQTANAQVEWEFPGGMNPSSTDDKVVTASFNSFGYYTVKVTVTENNCSTSSSVQVLATYTPTYCSSANFNIGSRATPENQEVMIDWKVLNDGISYSFDVERSSDGSDFSKIAEVKDPKLIKAGYKEYEYVDATPKRGRNLYRVKMNDPSGEAALSNILDLMLFEPGTRVMVYPNPVQDRLMVEFMEDNREEEITVELATTEGGIIRTFTWDKETVQNNLDFSKLPAGMYFIRVKIGSETTEVMKVMKKE